MTETDRAVKLWYSQHFAPSSVDCKFVDWRLANVELYIRSMRVLNLGCGYPVDEFFLGMYAKRWVAVDFTPEVIARCKEMRFPPSVEFYNADFRALPFEAGVFDTCLDFSASDHVCDGRDVMWQEVFRVLTATGRLVITYANRDYFTSATSDEFGFELHLTPAEIFAELCNAGFEILLHEEVGARSGLVAQKAGIDR